jgi:hypothetical protein
VTFATELVQNTGREPAARLATRAVDADGADNDHRRLEAAREGGGI